MMSISEKYELLKINGTWLDRLKFLRSLSNKTEIEQYVKQSRSHEDLQTFVLISKLTKNENNLLHIFKTDSYPIGQRIIAAKAWLKIQTNEQLIFDFAVNTILDKNNPQRFKTRILKSLHQIDCIHKSSTFFYNLACRLNETCQINSYLIQFCSKEQTINLFSRWSITSIEQLRSSSLLRSKLIFYQYEAVFHLIRSDLQTKKTNPEKFLKYFQHNNEILSLLAEKDAKEMCRLIIEYLNQLENHQRSLPHVIQCQQKYFFKKAPDEMIELITIIASSVCKGTIKYQTLWEDKPYDLDSLIFPRSFSLEHYIRLFYALYDTCHWSTDHTIRLLQYMLQGSKHHIGLSSLRKRRKWLIDIVISERIGKDKFIEELLKEGDEKTLELFGEYAELTTPLSVHLISEYHKNKNLSNKQHLSLLRYQFMTEEVFNQFLTLFNQISSNPNQREQFYILFFQCAVATNDIEQVNKVFQWIQNRFTNERLNVIETFLRTLPNYDNQFQLEFMPKNFDLLETIIELVLKRFPQINNSLNTIANYSSLLLQRVESHPNQDQRETIQTFAIKTIKRFLASSDCTCFYLESFSSFQPKTCHRIADILVSELFTKLLSKHMLNDLTEMLRYYLGKSRYIPAIDLFIESFFLNHLPLSTKLQSAFCIDAHSLLISSFLKNRSTKVERVKQLIEKFDTFFFLDKTVQRIALYSQQYRQIIDQLIEDDKCLTFDKLSNNQTNFQFKTNKLKYPGLDIDILNSAFCYLTGKQQGHISKIILHEFLLDKDVTNPKKIKALRVLHHFTHVFDESLQWFNEKQSSSIDSINIDPLEHILLCVPITFDLAFEDLLKQMNLLTMKINASNAKYISDAMLSILRRIPEEIFLTNYLQFIHSEQFQKLGITANKEILRLLTEFTSDSSLITSVIEPLWNSRLHPDVRACLILTLLYFMDKLHSEEEKTTVWKILEEAANDNYLPVIQCLFSASRGNSRWPLSKLMDSSNKIFQIFVDRIQFKILDHPTSLEARLWAWTNIESEHCSSQKLMEKSIQLCTEFNKEANTLWGAAFDLTIVRSSVDIIATVLQKLMSYREEIDGKENGLDAQHDLPVYHRIQCILTKLISRMYQCNDENKLSFHSLTLLILEFDKTLAPLIGKLLINIAKNKEDLEEMLILFQENLSEDYFERIVKVLGTVLSKSCSLIQQLTVEDKLDLVQWFMEEKKRELFVFELFKNHLLNQSNSNREQCQNLLRLLRQNGDLYLRQQAMEYTVRWKQKKEKPRTQQKHERKATPKINSDPDISDLNMLGIFDTIESQ